MRDKLPKGISKADAPVKVGHEVVGLHEQCRASYPVINLLSQVRQDIDPEEMRELVDAIIIEDDEGNKSMNLIQPVTLGLFTDKELEKYLKKLNKVWGSSHELSELEPLNESEDHYLIVIAGHRRMLAIAQAAEIIGINIEDVEVVFNMESGSELTFRKAIQTQYRENFHKKPESWEDAFAINSILREGIEDGDYQSFADCARDLGISDDRVAKAYRFQTLPEATQQLVRDKLLSYTRGLMITELYALLAYDRCSPRTSKKQKEAMAAKLRQNKLYLNDVMEYVRKKDQAELEIAFSLHASKASGFKKDIDLRHYIDSTVRSILDDDQLMLVSLTERDTQLEAQRAIRQAARGETIKALRQLALVLSSDIIALQNKGESILTTNRIMKELVGVIARNLDNIDSLLPSDSGEALAAVEAILAEAEKDQQADSQDMFTTMTL